MADSYITPNSKMWMVRSEDGLYLDHFLTKSKVDMGWGEAGPIKPTDSKNEIRQRCAEAYPGDSNRWHQIRRFVQQTAIGDGVVTYDGKSRTYHIGVIRSDAEHIPDAYGVEEFPGYSRRVDWTHQISRDSLSADARNKLLGQLTVFGLRTQTARELIQLCYGETSRNTPVEAAISSSLDDDVEEILDTADILKEYIEKSDEFVEDQIAKLDPYQLQELVAGILRAMGYRTRVSSPGPDRGVDIFASPDGLGLSEPRIFVEVKHRAGAIGSQAIRTFTGGRQDGDRCLYVSTGGFSRDARYEADRSRVPLTLLAMPDLRELLVNHYEDLDPETRALVPLKRVYWPVAE